MALIDISNQYRYTGRGPFDAKALVKTYAELISTATWTTKNASGADVITAYNGMLTAVWLNKEDTSKNGIYFLHDTEVTSPLKTPDVTKEANWHKLVEIADMAAKLAAIDERIAALEEDSDVISYGYRKDFPGQGEANKLYVAADEGKTYIWFNDEYLSVGGEQPEVIFGGSASNE